MNWVVKNKLNRSIKWMGRFMTIVLFMGLFISCRSQSNGWVPCNTIIPKYYWNVSDIKYGSTSEDPYAGLRKHLLYQSMSGLSYRAVMEKKGQIALWDGTHPTSAYENSEKDLLEMGIQKLGNITTYELAMLPSGEKGSVKDLFDGYILTDLEAEIESGMYATNAAHVYNAIIVDSPFYETAIPLETINDIEITDDLGKGVRTNGTDAIIYTHGHCTYDRYGDCLVYKANLHPCFLIIYGDNETYIINDDNVNDTKQLYHTIKEAIK